MTRFWSRSLLTLSIITGVVGGALLSGTAAQAHPVTAGSLEVVLAPGSEPLNYVIGENATAWVDSTDDRNTVSVDVNASNGDWWSLIVGAPYPDPLTVGTYTGATRASFREPGTPGLEFSGNGWGCSDISGSFAVNAVAFGPNRYVQTLDVTFEQYCGLSTEPVTGHLVIDNPTPPLLLSLSIAVAGTGTVASDGLVTLHGTVTCSAPTDVEVYGLVRQVIRHVTYQGSLYTTVACTPGAAVPWEATSVSDGPFRKGTVEVTASAVGWDAFYGTEVRTSQTFSVRLIKA